MCGFAGFLNSSKAIIDSSASKEILEKMSKSIYHRGQDEVRSHTSDNFNLIFNRLSIMDLNNGSQPFVDPSGKVVLACNGEIYNHIKLKKMLENENISYQGHSDTEVLLYLYIKYGKKFVEYLDGQFAIVVFDGRTQKIILIRDHFGVCPLFYTKTNHDDYVFASEIKAILEHPHVVRKVNLRGFDEVLTFPGIVSPTTMFSGIHSVPPASMVIVKNGEIQSKEYWKLAYPISDNLSLQPENEVTENIDELLRKSVRKRLQSDIDLGLYLSGGLDSSILGAYMKEFKPEFKLFGISFKSTSHDESKYQKIMAKNLGQDLHLKNMDQDLVFQNLKKAIYQCETVLKESYNACSLYLSELAYKHNTQVILSGEGADEFFGGYIGYRFDHHGINKSFNSKLEEQYEKEKRFLLWEDEECAYEKKYFSFEDIKRQLYAEEYSNALEVFSASASPLFKNTNLIGRHPLHKRAWLDYRLRLADHLISDHGDRMSMSNTVEVRYPYLDKDLIEYMTSVHPSLLLKNDTEKYLLKKLRKVPEEILKREKFGFHSYGTPELLQSKVEWVSDYLSYDYIKQRRYFNPDSIEYLKEQYSSPGFQLKIPHEDDILMCVLTFNLLLEAFELS